SGVEASRLSPSMRIPPKSATGSNRATNGLLKRFMSIVGRWRCSIKCWAGCSRNFPKQARTSFSTNCEITWSKARRIGMSEAALRKAVERLRLRYQELFRQEIAHTVTSPAEVEDELRHLQTVMRS